MAFEVLYLTGAPASGKSSSMRVLRELFPHVAVFEYGERLTAYVQTNHELVQQRDLREHSAAMIRPEDVEAVDEELFCFVEEMRVERPIVVDSHAVTKESFGFRITPFSIEQFARLNPTRIAVLYSPPPVTLERIAANPEGRPSPTEWEAGFHTGLQGALAAAYSIVARTPAYFIDSAKPQELVVDELARLLNLSRTIET